MATSSSSVSESVTEVNVLIRLILRPGQHNRRNFFHVFQANGGEREASAKC